MCIRDSGAALPKNARYIGTLSRMGVHQTARERYDIAAVISGPEPQRTLLEHRLMEQLGRIAGNHLLVLGQPDKPRNERSGSVSIRSHMSGDELAGAMSGARLIVSRSGYTTLMDLAALGRSALIIPTPGQQEQEYLGRLHARTGRFLVQSQESIDLMAAMKSIGKHEATARANGNELLAAALHELAGLMA